MGKVLPFKSRKKKDEEYLRETMDRAGEVLVTMLEELLESGDPDSRSFATKRLMEYTRITGKPTVLDLKGGE